MILLALFMLGMVLTADTQQNPLKTHKKKIVAGTLLAIAAGTATVIMTSTSSPTFTGLQYLSPNNVVTIEGNSTGGACIMPCTYRFNVTNPTNQSISVSRISYLSSLRYVNGTPFIGTASLLFSSSILQPGNTTVILTIKANDTSDIYWQVNITYANLSNNTPVTFLQRTEWEPVMVTT